MVFLLRATCSFKEKYRIYAAISADDSDSYYAVLADKADTASAFLRIEPPIVFSAMNLVDGRTMSMVSGGICAQQHPSLLCLNPFRKCYEAENHPNWSIFDSCCVYGGYFSYVWLRTTKPAWAHAHDSTPSSCHTLPATSAGFRVTHAEEFPLTESKTLMIRGEMSQQNASLRPSLYMQYMHALSPWTSLSVWHTIYADARLNAGAAMDQKVLVWRIKYPHVLHHMEGWVVERRARIERDDGHGPAHLAADPGRDWLQYGPHGLQTVLTLRSFGFAVTIPMMLAPQWDYKAALVGAVAPLSALWSVWYFRNKWKSWNQQRERRKLLSECTSLGRKMIEARWAAEQWQVEHRAGGRQSATYKLEGERQKGSPFTKPLDATVSLQCLLDGTGKLAHAGPLYLIPGLCDLSELDDDRAELVVHFRYKQSNFMVVIEEGQPLRLPLPESDSHAATAQRTKKSKDGQKGKEDDDFDPSDEDDDLF
eukprot:g9992.t1